jgi:geranylgeranyl pyrophosphate synthase
VAEEINMDSVQKFYDEVVSHWSPDDQLRLAALILNGIVSKMPAQSNKQEEEVISLTMTRPEYEQMSALLEEVVEKMRESNERMAKDEEETARLRAETQEILRRDWKGGVNVEELFKSFPPVPRDA